VEFCRRKTVVLTFFAASATNLQLSKINEWRHANFGHALRSFIVTLRISVDLSNIEIKYVARYILSVALRMSDVSSGCVNTQHSTLISELWMDLVVKKNLVVKSQQDDSIQSGIVIRNLCCELLVYAFWQNVLQYLNNFTKQHCTVCQR